ncbi:MAG: lipoyl(octanoyl) transferase LipB [Bacteroidales bacterium]|nr:lipoyl(octanoyl) transferase LipB [Bacteroidales bacterium]
MKNKKVRFQKLGRIPYKKAWDLQEKYFAEILSVKQANKEGQEEQPTPNHLLFCEHTPVYTLGKSGKESHLLLSEAELEKKGATFYRINRGGDITFHGPGQITGYPILDLENFGLSIKDYIFGLEEVIIRVLKYSGILAGRSVGETGVWIDIDKPQMTRKIGAIGARISQMVSMHGFALNVNTNLDYYNYIVPCGIPDKGVTSLQKELGETVELAEVQNLLLKEFESVFGMILD